MAKDKSAELMQALMAKLYATITGDDEDIQIPRNKWVTWLMPGIPFEAYDSPDEYGVRKPGGDFRYCMYGFNAGGDEEDGAEEVRMNYHQAFVLSKFLDYVPEINKDAVDFDMQQTIFTTTQDSISSIYKDVLNHSMVLDKEISDKEKEKIKRFRDLLSTEVEEEDFITGEVKTVVRPGKLTLAYNAKMQEYIEAANEYKNLQIEAQSATGNHPEALRRVYAWQKARFYRNKMEAAYMAWVSQGYKLEYEKINAYIDQVTRRSLLLYKQDLINKLENSIITGYDVPLDFYYTTLFPAHFAVSPAWATFYFYEGDYETHHNQKITKRGAGGGLNLGFFRIGGGGGGRKTEIQVSVSGENFFASFEFAQVQILRPWFEPGFFAMRSWDLDNEWNLTFDKKPVSDGKQKPTGRLVAYPVTALFVRDVKFYNSEWKYKSDFVDKGTRAGGSVSWGPFSAGGSYSSGSVIRNMGHKWQGGWLEIPGIQLIGFINNIVPKCPNLNPEINRDDLVGGKQVDNE